MRAFLFHQRLPPALGARDRFDKDGATINSVLVPIVAGRARWQDAV